MGCVILPYLRNHSRYFIEKGMIKLLPMKIKAIGLVSGGLDSIIATGLMLEQDIDVILLKFASPFFHTDIRSRKMIDFMGMKARVITFDEKYFNVVKNPVYGYGSGMNPCIDCKTYMLKIAGNIMEKEKASFIFTGEVINQRPFSQTRNFLQLIERKSGLKGKILRPLSAKLLEPTTAEIEGIVNREKLLAISGRSRKKQIEIVEKFGFSGYSQPAGGCLLTDRIFAQKMKVLFKNWQDCTLDDSELIKHGRVFWYKNNLIIIGRNEKENKILASLRKSGDITIEIKDIPSPFCLIRGKDITDDVIEYTKKIILKYVPKTKDKNSHYLIRNGHI